MTHVRKNIGILFDLDGVVIDSEGAYTDFWSEIGRRYDAPSPSFALDIKGTTLTDILSKHFPDPKAQAEIKAKLYDFEAEAPFPVFDEAVRFLRELADAGIPRAMVTSSDAGKMASLSRRHPSLPSLFTAIITGSMVSKSKPDPQGYIMGAEAIGIKIDDCVVFEDSLQGLEAGRRSGAALVVGLATTSPADRLKPLADIIISDFSGFSVSTLRSLLNI